MAKKPIRIADVLGFGGGKPSLMQPSVYRRAVARPAPSGKIFQGEIKRARPTAAEELAQLLTPDTRFGAELAAKIAPAVDASPLGILMGLVDARRAYNAGNTGQAAGLGILAGLGAIPAGKAAKSLRALEDIRPSPDDVYEVMQANTSSGKVVGNKMIPIDELSGGVSNALSDQRRVDELVKAITSPEGYISRLIVDDAGNVIEGQHRLEALRKIGVKEVPVTQYVDYEQAIPFYEMKSAAENAQSIHPDNAYQIANRLAEIYAQEDGNIENMRKLYIPPQGFERAWNAALDQIK